MRKIKTLFAIDRNINKATDNVVSGSEWVLNNEGTATEKFDGSSCLYKDSKLWKRYDRKLKKPFAQRLRKGQLNSIDIDMFKAAPEGFEPCETQPDPKTGHWPGWVPVDSDKPEDRWHVEALGNTDNLEEGASYELVGPKVQGNLYGLEHHQLWQHGSKVLTLPTPLTFKSLERWITANHLEGVVWHHPDGRMIKLRKKDFGLKW